MSRHIDIKFVSNGYIVTFADFSKNNGETVYKATEEFKMLEDLGFALIEKKVQVTEK